ncbi:MAG TPA: TolC family protein [Myxococcales bacterium]|nr:TolC family protein [Myxococcales bacterium]
MLYAALAASLISAAAQQPAPQQTPVPQPGAPVQPPPEVAQPAAPPPPNALTLEQAIQIALERNYDLRRSQYAVETSEQNVVIARALVLPRLDFNASVTKFRQNGETIVSGQVFQRNDIFWQYSGNVALRQLIFDGGNWWNNLAAANRALASSQASVEEQRLTTTYTVEQRFYELVRQQRQLKVLGDAAQRSRDQADFTQRLFEGGRATQADVYAARANRDNDEINRLGQEAAVELARQDLALTVGVNPAEPLAIAEPAAMQQDPAAPPPAREAVDKALTRRPSLKAFALTVESQQKAAAAAKGGYWPTISLNAFYGRSTPDLSTFDDPNLGNNSQLSAGVNLSWNLFSGFSTKANVQNAEINVLLAMNDLENGRRTVASDVERAIAQLAVARQQARIATQTEQTSSENLRLARTRQQVGVGTQLEVRDAELKLTQSELARANALVNGHEAESALRRATGG